MDSVQVSQNVTKSMIDTLQQIGVVVEKVVGVPLEEAVVHIQIDLKGDLKGYLILELTKGYACKLANIMLAGMMTVTEVDDMCKSVLGELFNMLSGGVCTCLSGNGLSLDITPPKVSVIEKSLDCKNAISLQNSVDSEVLNAFILVL